MKISLLYVIVSRPDYPVDRRRLYDHVIVKEMETQRNQVLCPKSSKNLDPSLCTLNLLSFPESHSLPYLT